MLWEVEKEQRWRARVEVSVKIHPADRCGQ